MRTLWIGLAMATALCATGTPSRSAPTVGVTARVNGALVPTGGTVAAGTKIDYTVTVANPDTPKALVVTAKATYTDAGVAKEVTASSTVNVVSVVRPVITLMVPTTLALDASSLATSGDWAGQNASVDSSLTGIVWSATGDLAGGKAATLNFSGLAR